MPLYHLRLYKTFYCDYFYQSNTTNYAVHCGSSSNGNNCGFYCTTLYVLYSAADYFRGASISFKHYTSIIVIIFINKLVQLSMPIVVVVLLLIYIVDVSMLILVLMLLVQVQLVVPVYHLNYTPIIVIIFIKILVLNIVFEVVILMVDFYVGVGLILSIIHLLGLLGILVPAYHLNYILYYCDYFYQTNGTHYARRGGASSDGADCGAFCVNASSGAGTAHWSRSAALSFK